MSVFEYLKILCKNDEFAMDFSDYSLENNKIRCRDHSTIFGGVIYCGRCAEKCRNMEYLHHIFWNMNCEKSYTQKKRFFVCHLIKNTDIFIKLYNNYYKSFPGN